MGKCPFQGVRKFFGNKSVDHSAWLRAAQEQQVSLQVQHDRTLVQQMKMISLTEEEIKFAKSLSKLVETNIQEIVAVFYQTVLDVEQLRTIIENNSTVERLKKTLQHHLIEMFSGQIDEEFLGKRRRVAEVHVRLGVEPKWYIGAFQNLQDALIDVICEHLPNIKDQRKAVSTITKLLTFEQQVVLEAYEHENLRQQEMRYEQAKQELKDKILHISEELAALTVQTNVSVESLVESSQQVGVSVQQTAKQTLGTQRLAQDGQLRLHELNNRMQTIDSSLVTMEGVIQKLIRSANQIQDVVKWVQTIASQTSLLSLNSAIEAARAGEQGLGFAVVATEVRKLSEQTEVSALQIAELANHSNAYTQDVIQSLQQVKQLVASGQEEFLQANASFSNILQSMDLSQAEVQQMESQIQELVSVIEEIGSATNKVATSADVLNVAAKEA